MKTINTWVTNGSTLVTNLFILGIITAHHFTKVGFKKVKSWVK